VLCAKVYSRVLGRFSSSQMIEPDSSEPSSREKGNSRFKSGDVAGALECYTQAIKGEEGGNAEGRATLLGNRAACHLKLGDLHQCVTDCTEALELNPTFVKALYRRSQAYAQQGENNKALHDLLRMLKLEPQNKDGLELMRQVRTKAEKEREGAQSEVKNGIRALSQAETVKQVEVVLRALVNLCVDDKSHALEFLRSAGLVALENALEKWWRKQQNSNTSTAALILTVLTSLIQHAGVAERYVDVSAGETAAAPGRLLLDESGQKLKLSAVCALAVGGASEDDASMTQSTICLIMRILKGMPLFGASEGGEDDEPEPFMSKSSSEAILQALLRGLKSCREDESVEVFSLVTDAAASFASDIPDFLTPEKLIDERLESLEDRKARMRRLRCARKRSKANAQLTFDSGFVDELVQHLDSVNQTIKTRAIACFGRLVQALDDDEAIKSHFGAKVYFIVAAEDKAISEFSTRAAVTAALYIPRPELGTWALGREGDGPGQLLALISTGDVRCQDLAAEVLCLASASEDGGALISSLVNAGALKTLLQSPNSSTRAAAASALTKLSLKAKAMAEESSEVAQVLNTAFDVLRVAVQTSSSSSSSSLSSSGDKQPSLLVSFSAFDVTSSTASSSSGSALACTSAPTTVERAVEIIASMIGRTHVKEEIVHGSFRLAPAIQTLVAVSPLLDERSTAAYGIAHILASITVTNSELRSIALAEKDISPEQYEQLQELQRIKTKDEKTGQVLEEKKEDKDKDTAELCNLRIKRLISNKETVPLLCRFVSKGSPQTIEAATRALRQVCVEESVRGVVIQQGGLKACCQVAMNESVARASRREAAHAVAKTLITINPNLLSEHQRLGAVQPLLYLCREVDSSNLQQYEALLSLANICSCGQAEQDKLGADKGVSAVHYLIFTEHTMVRRAACEVLCNMSTHADVLKLLRAPDKVRLWLGLCEDWDNGCSEGEVPSQQSVLTSRAAAGTLAMAIDDEEVCAALVQENVARTLIKLFESENPELVHRALVLAAGLASSGGKAAAEHLVKNNILPALVVVANLVKEPQLKALANDAHKVISAQAVV